MKAPRTLAVLAKEPSPGRVKTRLAVASSPDMAAELAHAFFLDGLDRYEALGDRRVVVFEPPEAIEFFHSAVAQRYELVPQASGDLGQRLQVFFAQEFDKGARAVVALGIDSPTLPVALVTQAFEALTTADIVVGPAIDGGYYLIGCSRPLPAVFANIAWSTAAVLRQTVSQVESCRARLALLPPWYDVDTLADLRFLQDHLAAMRLAGIDPELRRTERVLSRRF